LSSARISTVFGGASGAREQPVVEERREEVSDAIEEEINLETETTEHKIKRSFFDRYVEKIKDFLDNAE